MNIVRIIAVAAISFAFSGQVFGQNLITNGGFESAGSGWNLYITDTVAFKAAVTYPTTGAAEGTTYAHVNVTKVTGANPDSINWMVQLQFPQWIATKNANYQLSFKAKSSATALKVGESRGGSYAYVNGFVFTLTATWQTYSCMFTSDTSGAGKLLLNFYVGAAVGTYDFDSVTLVQTGTTIPTNSLISNGGFELEGAGWYLYVQSDANPPAAATVSYPSTGAPEGSKYASVNVTAATDASQVQLQLPLFTAEANAKYILTYKARGTGIIELVSQSGSDYSPIESFSPDLTPDWATYSQTFTSTTTAGSGALRINFWIGTPGSYDFDSVSVVKTTTSIRAAVTASFPIVEKLTARKSANGMMVTVAGPRSQGGFWLGVFSPEGRMIKSVSVSRESAGAIFVPMNTTRGTYIIRFKDTSGDIVKKVCWMR